MTTVRDSGLLLVATDLLTGASIRADEVGGAMMGLGVGPLAMGHDIDPQGTTGLGACVSAQVGLGPVVLQCSGAGWPAGWVRTLAGRATMSFGWRTTCWVSAGALGMVGLLLGSGGSIQ